MGCTDICVILVITGALCGLGILGLIPLSLIWVYIDAQQRGKTGCLWLLIAFFTWPLGVVAYYVLRDKPVQL